MRQLRLPMDNLPTPNHAIIRGKGTGAMRQPEDPRDYRYALGLFPADLKVATEPKANPEYRDLRRRFDKPDDQGSLGSCTANATAGAIEFLQWSTGHYRISPSRLALYYDSRSLMGPEYINQDSGAYLRDVMRAATNFGIGPESLWQYDIQRFNQEPPVEYREAALLRQALSYSRIEDGSIFQMETCIAAGYPFVFGIDVYPNFNPYHGTIPLPKGQPIGGHAMLAVGYSRRTGRILVRNSWGTNWGLGGYAWLPNSYMEQAWDIWTLRTIENPE